MHLAKNILKGKKMDKEELKKEAREELQEYKKAKKGTPKGKALMKRC